MRSAVWKATLFAENHSGGCYGTLSSDRVKTVQQIMERLQASRTPEAQAAYLAELRASVKHYGERYGLPSNRIHNAIDGGELIEYLEVGHEIFQYDLLRDVELESEDPA